MIPTHLQGLTSRMDPVPPDVLAMAKEALAWRDCDTALAQLVAQESLAAVRGDDQPELLTFVAGELTIEVEVTSTGANLALTGQLVPPQPGRIRIDHTDGPSWLDADELGRFAATAVSRGHVRLACLRDGETTVQTPWTLL